MKPTIRLIEHTGVNEAILSLMANKQDTGTHASIQETHWHSLVDAVWVILFMAAIGILIASLPGWLWPLYLQSKFRIGGRLADLY